MSFKTVLRPVADVKVEFNVKHVQKFEPRRLVCHDVLVYTFCYFQLSSLNFAAYLLLRLVVIHEGNIIYQKRV